MAKRREQGPRRDVSEPGLSVESEADRERREFRENANQVIEASFAYLQEQFEVVPDEAVDVALRDLLTRDAEHVPPFLRPYMGWEATDVPDDVMDATREFLRMPFHNAEHSRLVLDRTERIMEAMWLAEVPITEEEFQVGRMVAAGHDLVQRSTVERDPKTGKRIRKRFVGQNERESADLLLERMREAGIDADVDALVYKALEATIPGWDNDHKTVEQPALTAESHPVVRALALADLGAPGMDTEAFLSGGDALFREENLDMVEADLGALSDEERQSFVDRMLGWNEGQVTFARGRQARFEQELGNLPEEAKTQLRVVFSSFESSIQAAEATYQRRRGLSLEDLYADMGFAT